MADKICDVCQTPKPDICFDHSEARHGSRKDTCRMCLRTIRRPARRRQYARTAEQRRVAYKQRVQDGKANYDAIAEALESGRGRNNWGWPARGL